MNDSSAMMSDLPSRFWHVLALPDRAMLGVKITRKTLTDNAALTQADKALLQTSLKSIEWRYTLKPDTVNIPTLIDDKREYLEIAVLAVTLKDRSKVKALCHLLHQHIPYPLLLAVSDVGDLALSLAEKQINQSDSSKLTLHCHYDTGWLSAIPDERLNPFFANMTFDALSKVSLFDFYRDLIVRVTKLEASSWTGNYRTAPHQKDDDATLVQRLSELKALEVALNALRNQSSKAVQMNQKIKLNLQAQELKRKITALKATL